MVVLLKGWKYGVFIASIAGFTTLALYPIIIYPMMNPNKYREIQQQARAGIRQEDIQPGNMKVWTDPFDRKKNN